MNFLVAKLEKVPSAWPAILLIGILGGLAMGVSAMFQGRAGAGACDAQAETGEGFSNYLIAVGIIETTALFAMVFVILILNKIGVVAA